MSISEFKLELQSGNAKFGSKLAIFFVLCDLDMWCMTLKNHRAPFICFVKLCAWFQSHRWIQAWVTVCKRSIWVKICDFFLLCDLEIRWMTLENNKASFLASSFVHHFIAISEFKLELHSGNTQFGSKLMFLELCDVETWQMTLKKIGLLFYATSSYVHHFIAIGEFKL